MLQYLIKFLFISALILAPLQTIEAASGHYEASKLKGDNFLISADGNFKLKLPVGSLEPLDVYIFEEDSAVLPENFKAVSPIYAYYFYSAEDLDKAAVELTFSFVDNAGKTVYVFNERANHWQLIQPVSFTSNSLTVRLSGKSHQLFLNQEPGISQAGNQAVSQEGLFTVKLPQVLNSQANTTTIELLANLPAAEPGKRLSNIYSLNLFSSGDLNKILQPQDEAVVCQPYLKSRLSPKKKNQPAEVKKLQEFLKEEGFSKVKISGVYDQATTLAVKSFQESYSADILAPLGLKSGTGNALEVTLQKINELSCEQTKRAAMFKLTFKYGAQNSQAKSFYQWLEESEKWQQLDSIDNWHDQTVTVWLAGSAIIKVAVFEEASAWVGEASWYAWKNGDFAASRDFPKGSKLKVINQSAGKNQGKAVIVTVNDFGPEAWTKRIIDLDKAAFAKIGNLRGGILPVKIEVVD